MTAQIHITTDHEFAVDVTISTAGKRKTHRVMPDEQRSFDLHENSAIRARMVHRQAEFEGEVPPAAKRR